MDSGPKVWMPEVCPFCDFGDAGIVGVDEDNLGMGAVCLGKRRYGQVRTTLYPLRVVECKAFGCRNCFYELACAVGNQEFFVCCILVPDKFLTCISGEIKEQRLLGRIR